MKARHLVTIMFVGVVPAIGHAQGADDELSLRFFRVRQPLVGPTAGLQDSTSYGVSLVQVGSILVGGGIAIADDRTEADREQSRRLLAHYLEFAVPLMGFVDELKTLSTN